MPDLLIELFSEEIPARMQRRAAEQFKSRMTDGLVEAGLTYAAAAAFVTPRRLTLAVDGLLAASPEIVEERKGPRTDAPEKAIDGFLRSTGLARDALETRQTPKGAVYFAAIRKPGRMAAEIVAEVLENTIRDFPWPKAMRWGTGSLRWVRPLQRILCILTNETGESTIVPLQIDDIAASDMTEGHRFMAPGAFSVTSFEDYAAKLAAAHVVLSSQERAEIIRNDAAQLAFAAGLEVVDDAGLLIEVAGLVEKPVTLMGEIGRDFLDLPPEVLQTSMKEHQKFFSLRNPKTGRIERFITVANRETADDGATILAGNQKVLAARLSDAKFFWENDLRIAGNGMTEWLERLEQVTFQSRLGTVADQAQRIANLARELAPASGADPDQAAEAGQLCKADLVSEMVYEFPELQGTMGRYYAQTAGKLAAIADAIAAHYAPLGPSDAVPSAPVSVAVALAEKIDKLTGFWAIDEKPTGSKDPFALRRAALGVIRLVLENAVRLHLRDIFAQKIFTHQFDDATRRDELFELRGRYAEELGIEERDLEMLEYDLFQSRAADSAHRYDHTAFVQKRYIPADDLLAFVHDRLKVYLRDQGIRHDVIDASIAMEGSDDLVLLVKRAEALQGILHTEDGENLVQGYKRATNILHQAEQNDGVEYSYGADPKFAEVPEEAALFDALTAQQPKIAAAMAAEDFTTAMGEMAVLRAPIDAFFDKVQVNADNNVVRRNRLNLLGQIREICGGVADLSRLDG